MIRNALFVLAAAALFGATETASAQSIEFGPGGVRVVPQEDSYDRRGDYGISEREAIRIARSVGLRQVESVDSRRRSFEVAGYDRRNRDMVVVVDRRDGDVLEVQRD